MARRLGTAAPAPLFAFSGVTVGGAGRPRLDDLTTELPDGGITVVWGASGAGKSTLLRCCNRLEAPVRGTIAFRGRSLETLDVLVHRREVGMVFQRPFVFAGTVADNVRAGEPDADVGTLLERSALPATLATRDASLLSGGEQQRLCLARALATAPTVLLADEPTSALDPDAAGVLEGLLRTLADAGVPVVLVSHDVAQRRRLADHELQLGDGRQIA